MVQRVSEEELLDALTALFRAHGYAGTTLTRISAATGLGRASLYHRFPRGKADMADEVVRRAEDWLKQHALEPLHSERPPLERLTEMGRRLSDFFDEGRRSCLFEVMSLNEPDSPVRDRVRSAMDAWIQGVEGTLIDEGVSPEVARERAEDLVIRIQGSLVVARILGDRAPFKRIVATLAEQALDDAGDLGAIDAEARVT